MQNENTMGLALELITAEELECLKDNFCTILAFIILKRKGLLPKVFKNTSAPIIEQQPTIKESEYLTKKQVIELYHPLFTEYGLSQAVHKGEVPYIKRGRKYFFLRSDIDKWISQNGQANDKKRINYV